MESLAKLYDIVLNRRLTQWFRPEREQAGAQKKRGCIEHILTLRMLIDIAKHRRRQLYIVYVDFSKAYDRVPRGLMLERLAALGCGNRMIRAIATVYQTTKMILRTAIVTASIGVRQGSPTSCLLFTLVVNDLIRSMKEKCPPDGWLEWLHLLMLMDDTVLLATTRERAEQKIRILTEFCHVSGMAINQDKTKFMVINGKPVDKEAITTRDDNDYEITIENCNMYTYLGCIFTQDGNLRSAVKAQCTSKIPHVAKFEAFISKHRDAPYLVKEQVFEAALSTAILYSCESWLSAAAAECALNMYTQCIRCMLSVRKTTAGVLCLIEAGLPSVVSKVKSIQKATIRRLLDDREGMADDPFWFVFTKCQSENTPCARYIQALETFDREEEDAELKRRTRQTTRTKFQTYCEMINPSLTKHPMYCSHDLLEQNRIATSRLRLSSHNLAIERGRWLRKPREERLCPTCHVVQDERHALQDCTLNAEARRASNYPDLTLPNFFTAEAPDAMTKTCYALINDFI